MKDVVAGIFVGGASRRMGGRPKGLLALADGRTLVERWVEVLRELDVEVVLVGRRPEYARVDLAQLEDEESGRGPLGGLAALLAHAGDRRAIAVACDMPLVDADDLRALLCAAPDAVAVAPRREGRWEPLCAVYRAPDALEVARRRLREGSLSLQGLLDELLAVEAELPASHLHDWDRPEDAEGDATPETSES
jgi:molybdopterin-guanine dinucleotide biosynthesis protein A